jgi:aspartate racemase
MLMEIIYGQVKAGKEYDLHAFLEIIDNLKRRGADAVVLGCTELSVIHADIKIPLPDVVDSLSVLAEESIRVCGKKILL